MELVERGYPLEVERGYLLEVERGYPLEEERGYPLEEERGYRMEEELRGLEYARPWFHPQHKKGERKEGGWKDGRKIDRPWGARTHPPEQHMWATGCALALQS